MVLRRHLLGLGLVLMAVGGFLSAPVQARAAAPAAAAAVLAGPAGAGPQANSGSRDRIVEAIERKYNAKVVRVTEVTVGSRLCYDLRLLSDQRSWVIRVDAESGREMPRED